jgi:tricorn protease-like protein
MNQDGLDPLGLYVGTTAGEIWASFDEGESWEKIVEHLPDVYSIEVARF